MFLEIVSDLQTPTYLSYSIQDHVLEFFTNDVAVKSRMTSAFGKLKPNNGRSSVNVQLFGYTINSRLCKKQKQILNFSTDTDYGW